MQKFYINEAITDPSTANHKIDITTTQINVAFAHVFLDSWVPPLKAHTNNIITPTKGMHINK